MRCSKKFCNKDAKVKGLCSKHYTQHNRSKNPLKYAYQTLKDNSKRRGKIFNLTLEQFEQFCIKTDYLVGKGKTKDSYSIDRIENEKGYTIENIRKTTLSENSRKGTKTLHAYYDYCERKVVAYVTVNRISDQSEDCPF